MIFKRQIFPIFVTGAIAVCGAFCHSVQAMPINNKLDLKDKSGKAFVLPIWKKNKAWVFIFAGIECPISNRYIPLLNKMHDEYSKNEIQFFEVYSSPGLDSNQINTHAKDFGVKASVIWDYKQELSRAFGAKTTPQAIVVGSDGEIKYSGRIDNQYVSLGKSRNSATTHELDDALRALVKGAAVKTSKTDAVGCSIPKL